MGLYNCHPPLQATLAQSRPAGDRARRRRLQKKRLRESRLMMVKVLQTTPHYNRQASLSGNIPRLAPQTRSQQ
jgi:hypothetical protein